MIDQHQRALVAITVSAHSVARSRTGHQRRSEHWMQCSEPSSAQVSSSPVPGKASGARVLGRRSPSHSPPSGVRPERPDQRS